MWEYNYLNATVVVNSNIPGEKQIFAKYHRIKNSTSKIAKFEKFIKNKFPLAHHINYYNYQDGKYCFRNYLKEL